MFPTRKWRLFALACIEPFRNYVSDERFATVLETLAHDAEGSCSPEAFDRARALAWDAHDALTDDPSEQRWYYAERHVAGAISEAVEEDQNSRAAFVPSNCAAAAYYLAPNARAEDIRREAECRHLALVREIWGNPFRPVALDPLWLTFDVQALVRGIYDDKAFDRMPILADALQDGGCDSADVLNHCRGPGPHVRGCWVLDVLLEKA